MSDPAPEPDDVAPELSFAAFGEAFLRRVLHLDRVLESIDRTLGREFSIGPMGAGPGRKVATLTASGSYGPTYGEALPGPGVAYRVMLPVEVDVELQVPLDNHRFHAEVLVPLVVSLRVVEPLTIWWDITPPVEDEVHVAIHGETRRSAVFQRLSGFEGELRRFLVRFVDRELEKPHVQRARRIPLVEVIDGAWPQISAQFLPDDADSRD